MKKLNRFIFSLLITVIFFIILMIFFNPDKPPQHSLELKIAAFNGQFCALIFYAEHLGYFKEEGLKIDYNYSDAGVNSVRELLKGNADLATAAEFVAVNFLYDNPKLRILSSIAKGDVNSILYKKEINLTTADPKKIGLKFDSQADFFFQRFLVNNNLSKEAFKVLDTNPSDMLEKLTNKELDGVVVWDPFAFDIKKSLKNAIKIESVQTGQDLYFLLFSLEETIKEKEQEIELFLKALIRAQQHQEKNKDDFRAFLKERFNFCQEELDNTLVNVSFSVCLTQGLINAMEAEAQWNILTDVFTKPTIPNFYSTIEQKFLLSVAPDQIFLYQ